MIKMLAVDPAFSFSTLDASAEEPRIDLGLLFSSSERPPFTAAGPTDRARHPVFAECRST
jgi:hypothetical protein